MQFVKTCDLKPGMRLAKPIYNKLGVLLYERDTKLNAQGIESIKNFELIGIYILEPAEPVPPLSEEDIAFEQFQTITMFQLRTCMEQIRDGEKPDQLYELVQQIVKNYGSLDHKLNFTQNLRSANDFIYKHSISTAILTAMISHVMNLTYEVQAAAVSAALLYDIGYLYVPQEVLEKGRQTTTADHAIIQECRKMGLEKLKPEGESFLDAQTLKIIEQAITLTDVTKSGQEVSGTFGNGAQILKVADAFDRMTAMDLDEEPVSEIVAIRYLFEYPQRYNPKVVNALSRSIHILPTGSCVELSTNEKAMVLMDNPDNFMQPLVLSFRDNQVYDLRDPKVFAELQVTDTMKTMDNRIVIDKQALKQFYADSTLKQMADNFREKRADLIKKGRYGDVPASTVHTGIAQLEHTGPTYAPKKTAAPAPKRMKLK